MDYFEALDAARTKRDDTGREQGVVCTKDFAHHSETEYEVRHLEDCPTPPTKGGPIAPPHFIWGTARP
jgi:hypothetical protein